MKKKKNFKVLFILFCIVVLDFCMQDIVAGAYNLFQLNDEFSLTIRVSEDVSNGSMIQIYKGGGNDELFEEIRAAVETQENSPWSYIQGITGKKWTEIRTETPGAEITVTGKQNTERYILFYCNTNHGKVEIIHNGKVKVIDCNRDQLELVKVYPFDDNSPTIVFGIVAYSVLSIFFAVVLFAFCRAFERIYNNRNLKPSTIIYLFLISLLFVSIFKDNVNNLIVNKLLPSQDVRVVVNAKTEMEVDTGDINNPVDENDGLLSDGTIQRRKHEVFFHMTKVPEQYIRIKLNSSIKWALCEYRGYHKVVIFSEADQERGEYKLYPFAASKLKLIWSMLIYFVSSVVITLMLIMLHCVVSQGIARKRNIEYKKRLIWFAISCIVIYGIGLFQYINKINLPYYMPDNAIGDQAGYWGKYIFSDFLFDFNADFATFRGYTNYCLPSIAKFVGAHLSIDPVYVYLVFPALAMSWLTMVIIPQLFEILSSRKAKLVSVLLFAFVFIYYWMEWITLATTDLYNNVLFFATLLYGIKAYRHESIRSAIILGLSCALMINMHYSFIYLLLVVIIGYFLIRLVQNGIKSKVFPKIRNTLSGLARRVTKRRIVCFLVALVCFLMICAPQAVYNFKRGHIGLFPYDTDKQYYGHPVSWSLWGTYLEHGMVLWPEFVDDDQTSSMKTQLYEKGEDLNPSQAMDVYANSPIETAVALCKKILIMFDKKNNVNYGTETPWRETKGLSFSFFNFLVLLVGFYVLLRSKVLTTKEREFFWLLFFSRVIMNLAGHVEWRESMGFYIVLCMITAYYFIGDIVTDREKYSDLCNAGFYRFIAFGELMCFGISMTIWA